MDTRIVELLAWERETGQGLPFTPVEILRLEDAGCVVDLLTGTVTAADRDRFEVTERGKAAARSLTDADLRLLRRAQADAETIGRLHFAMSPTTAASCTAHGMTVRRWHWAKALLRRAGLHDGRCVSVYSEAEFSRGLCEAVEEVEREGLHLVRAYLVRNGDHRG